jgi:hypothetical protein
MSKLQFITVSIGVLGLGMIYSYSSNKSQVEETSQPKTEHYEYENVHHKMKVFTHKTWYGDTMLVTVDTTYYY